MAILVALAFPGVSARAVERTFDNQSGNGLWLTPANWSPDGLPGQFDPVRIEGGMSVVVGGNAGWVYSGTVGGSNGPGVLTINPGGTAYGVSFRDPVCSLIIGGTATASAGASGYNHISGTMDTVGDFIIGGSGGQAVAKFQAGNIWVGGTLRLGSYLYPSNTTPSRAVLRLIGGSGGFTHIGALEIGRAGTLAYEFAGGGAIKPMLVTSNIALLPGASLLVDGTGYTGGVAMFTLMQGSSLTGAFSSVGFTNFPASAAPSVVHANGRVLLLVGQGMNPDTVPAGLRLVTPASYSFGCAAGTGGSVWFGEFGSRQLRRWTANGQVEVVKSGMAGIFTLTTDRSSNLFVGLELGDQNNPSRILRIMPDGSESCVVSNITRPRQLTTDRAGNLYFATESPPRISRWNRASGAIDILGRDNIAVNPEGVAVAEDGTVYFSSYGSPEAGVAGTLQRISTNGTITTLVSDFAIGRARGIVLDEAHGCLYLCSEADMEDHGNSGLLIRYLISSGSWTRVVQGLDYPQFPCLGGDGRIYFSLAREDWLVAYDPAVVTVEETWPGLSNVVSAVGGGTWGQGRPGSRLKINVGGCLMFDGNVQAAASGGTVHGWLSIPASQLTLATNQIMGWNGRIWQPNPFSGIFELPDITYEADSGSCLIAAVALRGHGGVRWPMTFPGTINETPAAGFSEAPASLLVYFSWSTNDRPATLLSPPYREAGGGMAILKGGGAGWIYNDSLWSPAGQTWLNGGNYHPPDPSAWAELDLGAYCGKSKYIYAGWHVNGPFRPHATRYVIYDSIADRMQAVLDQTKHADGINHGNDTFSGWRLLGGGKINITPSTRLWISADASVAATEYLQSDAVLLSDHPIVDDIGMGATGNFEFNTPLSVASSGPTGVGHHWGMQGLGAQYTTTTNRFVEIRLDAAAFPDALPGYYNVEVSWVYTGSDGVNASSARYSLNGAQLPDSINQNRSATNQSGSFVAGNSIGSWSGFYRLSEPCYFSGTNPISVRLSYPRDIHTGRLVVDMVRFVPLGNSDDSDADGLPDGWMMDNFGHRTARLDDQSSSGDSPAGDGVPNLVKYALGLNAMIHGTRDRLTSGTLTGAQPLFLSLTYTRPEPPPEGLMYTVELSSSLFPAVWRTNETSVVGNTVSNGLRTITTRDVQPAGTAPQRYIRFKVSRP